MDDGRHRKQQITAPTTVLKAGSAPQKGGSQTKKTSRRGGLCFGVRCGARTHDTQNHNLVLYQLN